MSAPWLVLRASYGGRYTVAHERSAFAIEHRATGTLAGAFERIRDAVARRRELNREHGLNGPRRGIKHDPGRKPSGFLLASPEQKREWARAGGRASAASKNRKRFTSETGRAAGQKGGQAIVIMRGPEYMAEIGRRGGARSKRRAGAGGAP